MLELKSDLHLHSVLSPCGDLLMTPAEIVKQAEKKGIEVLALTDHNSAENAAVFKYYCEKYNLSFIPGIETTTKEEIHLLTYFPDLNSLFDWQQQIYERLPAEKNDEDFFGPQLKCNYQDQYQSKLEKMLAGAVDLSLEESIKKVKKLGGIVIPSHLDRRQSIISQLGFIPAELDFKTVEISKNISPTEARERFPQLKNIQLIQNSDSHYLAEIKAYHKLKLAEFSFAEFKKAVENIKGRKIKLINE